MIDGTSGQSIPYHNVITRMGICAFFTYAKHKYPQVHRSLFCLIFVSFLNRKQPQARYRGFAEVH